MIYQTDSPLDILLVEDNPAHAALIQENLRARRPTEFIVTWVEQFGEAQDQIHKKTFDLILLNLSLPDNSGLDAVIRVHEELPNLAIVVLTGTNDERLGIEALQAGAQDYIVKGSLVEIPIGRILRYAVERQRTVNRLQEFDRFKSEFLSTASHEMRTPLTVIRENINIVVDGVCGPINDEQRECLTVAQRHCDRMAGLLNDILDLKKIESGFIKLHRTQTDLRSLLMQCRTDFRPLCQSKGQSLLLEMPVDLPKILGDTEQVRQVLINLLGNALKFTPIGGTITLRAEIQSSEVRIEVQDTGRGIRPEDLNLIFDAFRQAEREDGPGVRGTGLGLTISKGIVDLHEGEIGVESEYGSGSTFYFTLPVWTEYFESLAYIKDRIREAKARKAPCSLLLVRAAHSADLSIWAGIMKTVKGTLRTSEGGRISPEGGYTAYVVEKTAQDVTAAFERLEEGLLVDVPEYAVRNLTTAQDAMEWISRGPEHWSALHVVSDRSTP